MNSSSNAQEGVVKSMRLGVFALLWLALVSQATWMVLQHFRGHRAWSSMWYPIIFLLSCLAVALARGRVRWIPFVLRVLIALAFLEAVGDRFGLLGPPGTAGVSWGNFPMFIHYTGVVNSFLPAAMIPALAVLATVCETVFGLTMLLGIRTRLAAAGSAALLFCFATAMTISGLSQFSYGVYMMCAGAAALSITGASFLSFDAFNSKKKRKVAGGWSEAKNDITAGGSDRA